jgi:GNAT superfamily N-acetyltransferase
LRSSPARSHEAADLVEKRMQIDVALVQLDDILTLRDLYRQEMNCQIVHDSLHARGHFDSYLIRADNRIAGYACVGGYKERPRITVKEFYLLPAYRASALVLFRELVGTSQATRIEVQTNDILLSLVFFDCVGSIEREKILFRDAFTTNLSMPGATFRKTTEADQSRFFPHVVEPVGDWLVEVDGKLAATGGILFHYNVPYGDIYMEVAAEFRRRGYGSYLVQELKRTCYEMGRVPAARCSPLNESSRATLQKAGLLPCAFILSGVLPPNEEL